VTLVTVRLIPDVLKVHSAILACYNCGKGRGVDRIENYLGSCRPPV
jgi:hypothetical protein